MEIKINLSNHQINCFKCENEIIKNSFSTEMKHLRDFYRDLWKQYQEAPTEKNRESLIEHLNVIKSFLIDHQEEIYLEAAAHGFPPGTNLFLRDPAICFSKALYAIETFQGPETPTGSLHYLNEQFTQLVYLCSHR